ncbi:MAG: acetyl/propionyl-CoA carboxylase subunit alpha, partial [Hyphomicrobiaceae bacterium]|nr:acetyl/propionyl-CoA carboxylase subunit alpha [Hyphomicrobiaceae bacterium]
AMGEQAVALAKAVGYDSAGTVEFVAGQDRSFFFLEMNTRLQVEHPVTELITGIDLVEQMIRVAAGERLAFSQQDVKLNGWAVESRIYAEDPYRGFLPSIGRLSRYRPPHEGSTSDGLTVRNDTGVYEGGEISMYYDPMIAKLVTHAPTRAEAIEVQSAALDAFYIDGIQHNIPFLSALMQHPRWKKGDLSTGFINEEYPDGFTPRQAEGEDLKVIAAVAASIDHLHNARRREITHQMDGRPVHFLSHRVVELGTLRQHVRVDGGIEGPVRVMMLDANGEVADALEIASRWWPGNPVWSGVVRDKDVSVQVRPIANGYDLAYRGIHVPARVYTEREAELAALMPVKTAADMSKYLLCPMPGLIKAINVEVGAEVKAGDPLAVVEAMKMENILRAERDGTVSIVNAKVGDSLAVDAVILEFA